MWNLEPIFDVNIGVMEKIEVRTIEEHWLSSIGDVDQEGNVEYEIGIKDYGSAALVTEKLNQ